MKSKTLILISIIALAFALRVYKVNTAPPGLYSDETAYGYNAFALLKEGIDEYGLRWPLTFKNFGDYKPPLTAWVTIPFIALFGLNEFAVRLPSVLAGTITIAIIYFLAKELFPNKNLKIAELSALLLAVSPWHLHFSRISMLVGIEAMFISLAVLLFIKALKKPKLLYLSASSFIAAIYTYYGSRITVPLLVIALTLIFKTKLKPHRSLIIKSALFGLLLLSPLLVSVVKNPATLTGRARTISIFYDPGIKAKLWQAHTLDGPQTPTVISRFFHNKPYFYFQDFARRYLQHFSYGFLVQTGDTHPPFKIPQTGYVYSLSFLFALYGFWLTVKKNTPQSKTIFAYLFISVIPPAFTFLTPSANRAFNMVIPLTILTAIGISVFLKKIPSRFQKSTIILLSLAYLFLFTSYLNRYYNQIPIELPHHWHYGRKQLIQKITSLENQYDQIIISNREGPAYIWILFYKQYLPSQYLQTVQVNQNFDELGWLHVESFDKYIFPRQFDWQTIEKKLNTLYVGYENQIPDIWSNNSLRLVIDHQINYPNGNNAFKLVHLETL